MAVHGSSGTSVVIRDVAAVEVLGRPSLPGGSGGYVTERSGVGSRLDQPDTCGGYVEEFVAFAEGVRSGIRQAADRAGTASPTSGSVGRSWRPLAIPP